MTLNDASIYESVSSAMVLKKHIFGIGHDSFCIVIIEEEVKHKFCRFGDCIITLGFVTLKVFVMNQQWFGFGLTSLALSKPNPFSGIKGVYKTFSNAHDMDSIHIVMLKIILKCLKYITINLSYYTICTSITLHSNIFMSNCKVTTFI